MTTGDITATIIGKFRTIELAVGAANSINLTSVGDQIGILKVNDEFILITYVRTP